MNAFLMNLALAGTILQAALVASVIGKRTWRSLPVFAVYSSANLLAALVLLVTTKAGGAPYVYFYAYWICESIGVFLGFAVVYEVFRELLGPYAALRRVAAVAFRWALVGLILLACIVAYFQTQHPVTTAVEVMEETARIVEVGLLVFLFAFSRAFGLHWRQNVFGIALGLGVFTSVELAGVALHTHIGPGVYQAFALARVLSFDLSLLIWMGYILAPERVTSTAALPQRAQLEQWNQAILELINQ